MINNKYKYIIKYRANPFARQRRAYFGRKHFDIFAKVTPLDESISSLQSDMIYLSINKSESKKGKIKKRLGKEKDCDKEHKQEEVKATSSEKYDINKATETLNEQAEPNSIGKCAKYVRQAIEAGGLSTIGRPVSAKDYKGFLPTLGFSQIATTNYTKGDIAVFEAFQGAKKYHEHGHIQMYNGTQWVSDFKQNGFWAGPDYRTYEPAYTIFRWK